MEFTTLQTQYAFELHLRNATTGWRLHISSHPRLTSEPARELLSAATRSFVADGKNDASDVVHGVVKDLIVVYINHHLSRLQR